MDLCFGLRVGGRGRAVFRAKVIVPVECDDQTKACMGLGQEMQEDLRTFCNCFMFASASLSRKAFGCSETHVWRWGDPVFLPFSLVIVEFEG